MLIAAMQAAGSTLPSQYLAVLAHHAFADTITSASWTYDLRGDLKSGAISVYQVQQGRWVFKQSMDEDASQP